MSDGLTITVESAAVQRAFDRMIRLGRDPSPMMAEIAEHLLESTQRRFQTSTGPDGRPWAALKDGSGRKPLLKSGTLRDQIIPGHGRDFAEIVASARYAKWHQEGTDPYTILPGSKKALSWPGGSHPVKKVNHPGLPARPFIGLSDEDNAAIEAIALAYLDGDDPV